MKWTANEHLGKNNKPPFVLLAKQSKHLILFPNKCDDSRTRVTRDLMEQKFSAPLRGEQMGHETAGATASKAPESQNLTSVIAQEWKKPPPGEMKLELLSQQSRDRSSGTAASSQLSVCKLNFNTFITNSSPAQMEWIFHGVTAGLHQPHSGAEQSQSSTCTPSRVWDIPSRVWDIPSCMGGTFPAAFLLGTPRKTELGKPQSSQRAWALLLLSSAGQKIRFYCPGHPLPDFQLTISVSTQLHTAQGSAGEFQISCVCSRHKIGAVSVCSVSWWSTGTATATELEIQ